MSLDESLAKGRALVEEIQAEAGWDPEEPNDPEILNRYIEALEATVAGQRAAAHMMVMREEPREA